MQRMFHFILTSSILLLVATETIFASKDAPPKTDQEFKINNNYTWKSKREKVVEVVRRIQSDLDMLKRILGDQVVEDEQKETENLHHVIWNTSLQIAFGLIVLLLLVVGIVKLTSYINYIKKRHERQQDWDSGECDSIDEDESSV